MGICGVLAVLNLMTSSGRTWFLLGREAEYADCSDFTDEQLAGVSHLEGFVCVAFPKAMACNAETNSGITNPDEHGFNTRLASTDDPLLGSFISRMRWFKFGLFMFLLSATAAAFSAEPEFDSKRPNHFKLAAADGSWSSAHVALAGVSLVAALLVWIGAYGMFHVDTEDFLYGDAAGGQPPLGPLQGCKF